jgi:hypothetical protein
MGYDYDNGADTRVGVDVSKATALEEITLDIVKLLLSYFSFRVLVVRYVFFRLNPSA